ncbi:ATP-binding protein [Magnetospirillum sp. UT-4]|uniref:sensor histidine kinase n=1 Tax=Magnetospirillum sp. UT-4 TaxID=2681467 RepID=UPI0013850B21|nr:ATP-binding protein [Magnetospirillum sp. UT-4]CAA7625587.1 putative Signal transduction histidine kinase [Magnetospirillum sp. UT-4]
MKFRTDSLSWQLLRSVLSTYFAITLAITVVQMGIEYFHARTVIRSELRDVENTFRPALSTALWELNREQILAIQKGILGLPNITSVTILTQRGEDLQLQDAAHFASGISHTFKVWYSFDGQDNELATVSFTASGKIVLDRVIVGFQMIVAAALIKSAVLVLLFFWVFRRTLDGPLGRLTGALRAVDLDTLGSKHLDLGLTGRNELTEVEGAFNRMLKTLDDERLESTRALRALNLGLEEQVEQRTRDLARSNADLEHFAYAASHDLREPLRMISSYLGLLERRESHHLSEEGLEFLGYAKNGAVRLNDMISALLDYARIGRDQPPHAPVSLDEVVEEVRVNLRVGLEENGARVDVAPPLPRVMGNRADLVRLFQNLIGNAVKYRAPDRLPIISISAGSVEGRWELAVADNGVGIPESASERVFELFQRLHGRDVEGSGIGLATCRRIVEQHGGSIRVEGEADRGSTFRLTLPAA